MASVAIRKTDHRLYLVKYAGAQLYGVGAQELVEQAKQTPSVPFIWHATSVNDVANEVRHRRPVDVRLLGHQHLQLQQRNLVKRWKPKRKEKIRSADQQQPSANAGMTQVWQNDRRCRSRCVTNKRNAVRPRACYVSRVKIACSPIMHKSSRLLTEKANSESNVETRTSRSASINSYDRFQPSLSYFFRSWMTALKTHKPNSMDRQTCRLSPGHVSSYIVDTALPPPNARSKFTLVPLGASTAICKQLRQNWRSIQHEKSPNALVGTLSSLHQIKHAAAG